MLASATTRDGRLVESLRVRVGLDAHHAVPVHTTDDAFNERIGKVTI